MGSQALVLGIVTKGRRDVLTKCLELVARAEARPEHVIVCPYSQDDCDLAKVKTNTGLEIRLVEYHGRSGVCGQRNLIIQLAQTFIPENGIVLFIDDDLFVHPRFFVALRNCFEESSDVVAAACTLIADGANSSGISAEQALTLLENVAAAEAVVTDVPSCYGCMAFRSDVLRANRIQFDENIPFWLEDLDMSRRVGTFGRIVTTTGALAVHLGVKSGKLPGRKLGYLQIANPIYLCRKEVISAGHAARLILKPLSANILKALLPEPYVDRIGRLRGNVCAMRDYFMGNLHPSSAK